jgi:glycogen(starch) synthase
MLPVEIIHANDFDTLPAGWLLARRGAARLVYDAHELYSAHETDPPWLYRATALFVERALARRADAVVTTGDTFASEVKERLRLREPPIIVLNAPEVWPDHSPESPDRGPLRIAYHAAADHAGRPIDDLVNAAAVLPDTVWTVRVIQLDLIRHRQRLVDRGLDTRVSFEAPLPADRLHEGLIGHHAGLILQRPITPNDALAIPNKLFEYMMAGLAVIAPNLPGLAIVGEEGIGILYDAGDPMSLADAVRSLAADRPRLDRFRKRARELAVTRYNAEAERPALRRAWGI